MIINKKINEITMVDLVNTGVYDGVDFQEYVNRAEHGDPEAIPELIEILDRGDQILKETFIDEKMDKILKEYKIVDQDFNLITTDYFIDNIKGLSLIGSRTVEPGAEETQDKNKYWYIEGYITMAEFERFPALYQEFKEKFSNYITDDWQLELNVIGGVIAGKIAVDTHKMDSWRKDGVNIEAWGFNEDRNMTCFTELLI